MRRLVLMLTLSFLIGKHISHYLYIHDKLFDLGPIMKLFLLHSGVPPSPELSVCPCIVIMQLSVFRWSVLKPSFVSPLLFLGPDCVFPSHSAPLSYHNHPPQTPPASPALLVHTECPQDYPLDDTIHQSVLHMPHHLGTAPLLIFIYEPQSPHFPSTLQIIFNVTSIA